MKQFCVYCNKEIPYGEELRELKQSYCGDCALEFMVKSRGVTEEEAIRILEKIRFGNGHKW